MAETAGACPEPPAELHAAFMIWPKGRIIHRVHRSAYHATQFNDTALGNARFSPIFNQNGKVIPTIYGGSTYAYSLMETIFHDVSYAPGFKRIPMTILRGQLHSQIVAGADLKLVDLSAVALHDQWGQT